MPRKLLVVSQRPVKKARGTEEQLLEIAPHMTYLDPKRYIIIKHNANPQYQYLIFKHSKDARNWIGCFACFRLEYMRFDAETMPSITEIPVPASFDVRTLHPWWFNSNFPEVGKRFSGEAKSFPPPGKGFKVGDYVGIRFREGAYGWVSAVVMRSPGRMLYLVCAVVDGTDRLLMLTKEEVTGPEFTFVPPAAPFWSSDVFPGVHKKDPRRFGYFEPPLHGFQPDDPCTVVDPGTKQLVDGQVAFTFTAAGLRLNYNVLYPDGNIVLFDVDAVFGPRVDRLNEALNPADITPSETLLDSVTHAEEYDEQTRTLLCDEDLHAEGLDSPGRYSLVFACYLTYRLTAMAGILGRTLESLIPEPSSFEQLPVSPQGQGVSDLESRFSPTSLWCWDDPDA
jgi:hypothetical protein